MKITPIRRKGCKNAGWIWDNNCLNKLVVPLHPGLPFKYVSDKFQMENCYFGRDGSLKKIGFKVDYTSFLKGKNEQI